MKQLWNSGWSFLRTEPETGFEETLKLRQEFVPVEIPHDWLIYDSEKLYEDGNGWYRKVFDWKEESDKRTFLVFDGIYMDSTVYVNGNKTGEWKYGYSSFTVEVTPYIKQGENEIIVGVCFRSPNSRWYSGAGIYRDVWLKTTKKLCIEENGVYISTKRQQEDFVLSVETAVDVSCGEKDFEIVHRLFSGEEEIPLICQKRQGNLQEFLVKEPRLWDVDAPVLYTLKTELLLDHQIIQEENNRFGFRYTEFNPDKGFFLNGRHLKLNGVCEHHDLGALGAAFNRSAMKRKFMKLKKMGVNAVRGSHNMMAPGFVDLADEMGILLISEAFDMWERSKTTYDYARFFKEWHERDVKAWVCRDRNHPSVIMWSIGNEIYDTHADERGQEITRNLKELVERYDPYKNARVTIASNYMPWENAQKCADIVKIAGYNYSEYHYEDHHKAHPDWVIFGSETSSIVQSRGVYHFPLKTEILSDDDLQCSALGNSNTSWGARSMETCVTVDRDTPFSMGQFLWTGFDYIGEPTPYHTKNSYFGQLDTAGFPKDSYYVWQSAWTDYHNNPMVHIFPYWDFNEGQLIDVRVCSNAPLVELFLNGRSLGRQTLSHKPGSGEQIIADYQVPYEAGVLFAEAYDENGKKVAEDEKKSFGNSAKLVIYPENTTIKADGLDLLFIEIGTIDKNGNPVENSCDRVQVEVEGAGRLVGLDNGDSTDYDSYKGKTRRLFNGKLLAMIQSTNEPGEILIRVSGKGLEGASLICQSIADESQKAPEGVEESLRVYEENRSLPIITGKEDEISVRKISLFSNEGREFNPEKKVLTVQAVIEPENADDKELIFQAVNDTGVVSNLVKVDADENQAVMTAIGDGDFRLRCMSRSGTDNIRLISQLEFRIRGMGKAYLDPYDFISGSLYTGAKGDVGSGNERGVATGRDSETVLTYGGIDFGVCGSDEITVPVFALDSDAHPIQIWKGIPGEAESELLADVVYKKPSIWNVYQPETWKLCKTVKGISTISFLLRQKVHIKGFSFKKYEKAWMELMAACADAVYGDSFLRKEDRVEEIGNNVSLEFKDMDFGEREAEKLIICGRALKGNNTIHVRFFDGETESKQIVEFQKCDEYEQQTFPLEPVKGKVTVSFVFMPGSCFDFWSFQFVCL